MISIGGVVGQGKTDVEKSRSSVDLNRLRDTGLFLSSGANLAKAGK